MQDCVFVCVRVCACMHIFYEVSHNEAAAAVTLVRLTSSPFEALSDYW